jgi:hypothetical protein
LSQNSSILAIFGPKRRPYVQIHILKKWRQYFVEAYFSNLDTVTYVENGKKDEMRIPKKAVQIS